MIVYLLTNRANGKYYVGQTVQLLPTRIKQHLADAQRKRGPLQTAIRKYGMDGFDVEVLAQVDSIEDLNSLETLWILLTAATDRATGYNCTSGGLNHIRTKDTRAKLSAVHLGRKPSPETVAKQIASNRGKKRAGQALENIRAGAKKREEGYTEEQRKRRSERVRGVPTGTAPPNKGKKGIQVAWNKGRKATEEERKRLLDMRCRQVYTPERCAKISATMKGRMPVVNQRRMASKLAQAEGK